MERRNNYDRAARQAQERFLTYSQQAIIEKHGLRYDDRYLYTALFGLPYRLDRRTGQQDRLEDGRWIPANSFEEVLTLLDLLCDSQADRSVTGEYRTLQSFGLQFHQSLVEDRPAPIASVYDKNPGGLSRACEALGGKPCAGADVGYILLVFEELTLMLRFWHGDQEFAPRLRYFWDSNALSYLRYETMYYAISALEERIQALL